MGRLLAIGGGVVWLAVIMMVALGVHWSERPPIVPPLVTVPTLLKELNAVRPAHSIEGQSWVVTKVISAHHVLIVNVDADRVGDAREIAILLVMPFLSRGYDEVLVYVWRMRHHKAYADRRVQWTPKAGYTELVIGD